jgi:hypothetical protein
MTARRVARLTLIVAAMVAIGYHCWWFHDFVVDDAGISFSYARTFAVGHGLTLTPLSERVEGYTNFLWVMLLAAGARLGVGLTEWAHLAGGALAAVCALGSAELLAALRGRRRPLDGAAALLVAALMPISYWSMSGLEGPLYMALLVWAPTRLLGERERPGAWPLSALLTAGLPLVRPDGALPFAVLCAARLVGGGGVRAIARWLALAAGPVAAHLGWRFLYYAYPVPCTFYAKVPDGFIWRELFDRDAPGWRYVLGLVDRFRLDALYLPAALSLLRWRRLRARLTVAALTFSVLMFPVYARGDWMSEGRFLAPVLPTLAVLAVDGCGRVGDLPALLHKWLRPPAIAAALAAAGALVVPASLHITKIRQHAYPVPFEGVGNRGRAYARLAAELEPERPAALDGDLGGTSFYAGMPIYDLGGLTDVTSAHGNAFPGVWREYMFGERRPTFMRIAGFWGSMRLQDQIEFRGRYVPVNDMPGEGISVSREALLAEGVDTRAPLARFADEGLELLGARVEGGEVRLWLLVREVGMSGALRVVGGAGGQSAPLRIGAGTYPPSLWRAGEVLRSRQVRPGAGALQLCGKARCWPLAEGESGATPRPLPAASGAEQAAAEARGDLDAAAAMARRRGVSTPSVAAALMERARAHADGGDVDRAFADELAALSVDRTRSFARRRAEELRYQLRQTYHPRWIDRLDEALRAFQLAPDAAGLSQVASLARAAARPESAVRAQIATGLVPEDAEGRLDLAEAFLESGAPRPALAFLPVPRTVEDAARVARIARAAGAPDSARRVESLLMARPVAVAPGLELGAAWARVRSTGVVELSLALRRNAASAADTLVVAGRPVQLTRAPGHWDANEVVVEPIALELPAGRARVSVGAALLDVDVPPFGGDFERDGTDGWTVDGAAFAPVTPRSHRVPRLGPRGRDYADSSGPGRAAQGSLRSPRLADGVEEVCFLIAGGRDVTSTGVRLDANGLWGPAAAAASDSFSEECLDARPLVGRDRRVVIYDLSPTNQIAVDDVECLAGGRPVACSGDVRVVVR